MDKFITVEWPYQRIVLDFSHIKPKVRELTPLEWSELEKAEKLLFREPSGYVAYTDVNIRAEDVVASALWDHCAAQLEAQHDNWDDMEPETRRWYIATRVARALALCVFGPEFLLK